MSEIKIINNLFGNHHYQNIVEIARSADTLYIISPFLMESFDTFFCDLHKTNVREIYLVTKLKSHDSDLYRKANALQSFQKLCSENNICYKIYCDDKLHGKIYIALKNNVCIGGLLTSANFTSQGLKNNHEWGLQIYDSQILKKLKEEVMVCSKQMSDKNIIKMIKKINTYFEVNPLSNKKIDLSVDEFIDSTTDKRYFLKPLGSAESHYPNDEKPNNKVAKLEFSRRKPAAVRVGDILICYAVGSTKLLGYFETISEPIYSGNDNERWPWSVLAKNLCPTYSENWNSFDNELNSLRKGFSSDISITHNGSNTLGTLKFGSDKIQLSEEFAKYLIQIIENAA